VFSIYGRTLSVKQAHHFGRNKCKIESPSEQQNLSSSIRLSVELDANQPQPTFFTCINTPQNDTPVILLLERQTCFKHPFFQILFEHFIAKNAP
jgi:hypothetical protein